MAPPLFHLLVVAAAIGAAPGMVTAGSTSTVAAAGSIDDMPMSDYLGLLAQISPAAQRGAHAYLLAFEQRCGRPLETAQLRRAMSDGEGDPVLMAMIRASQLRDTRALGQLGQRIGCNGWPAP